MLTINEINKLRKLYYEHNFSIARAARLIKCSRGTAYKYINFMDMSDYIKCKTDPLGKIEPYREVVQSWIDNDRLHHVKQRHTAKRVYERLKEEFPDFDCSHNMTSMLFKEIVNSKSAMKNGYLPLSHKPGEAQVDLGDCSFYDNGVKMAGKYLVMTFPYSNASYCQIMYNKSAESIVEAMRNIFEYLHGVPHTIWFDNDAAIVRIERTPSIKRTLCDIFKRFKLHYTFNDIYTSPNKGNEKGSVEQGVRFMRRNLLVPVPEFENFKDYNIQLLHRSTTLHRREHYIVKDMITDLHFDDLQELNKLPDVPFEPVSIKTYGLDNFGRLIMSGNIFYYLSPEYAFKKVQVKCTPKELEVYSMEGNFLIKTTRIYGKHGTRFINWSPYIRLLANKPAAILNFSFMDLFTDEQTIETIRNFHRTKLHIFLNKFADLIDDAGLDEAVKRVVELF